MTSREPIGYVVAVEGTRVTLNLRDEHRGQVAAHGAGVSSVCEIGGLVGIGAGARLLVLRTASLSFYEPREAQTSSARSTTPPLRQLVGSTVGQLKRVKNCLAFVADSLATPTLGAEAFPLTKDELSAVVNMKVSDSTAIDLGIDWRSDTPIRVSFSDMFSRHVAILGGTGQGKSCFVASLLQQLVKLSKPRIVVFDVNGEYEEALNGHIRGQRLKVTHVGKEGGFKIPYYALGRHGLSRLLLPSEKTQRPALAFALDNLRHVKWFPNEAGAGLANDSSACLFDDCRTDKASEAFNAINMLRSGHATPADSWPHMSALAALVADSHALKQGRYGMERDAFHYSNVAPLVTRIRRFAEDSMFTAIVDINGGDGRYHPGQPLDWQAEASGLVGEIFGDDKTEWVVHIVNLRQVAHDLMPFVFGSLLELFAFELFRRGQGNTFPTLLILEEAHHYMRQIREDDNDTSCLAYERLAKEGRKFGLGLVVSTQRPSEVSQTVLSQCATWVVFRLAADSDQRSVASAAEWIDKIEVSRIPGLPRQEALAFGSCIPVPVRFRVRTAEPTPRSADPDFSAWNESNNYSVIQYLP
jgi:hypothetical protein